MQTHFNKINNKPKKMSAVLLIKILIWKALLDQFKKTIIHILKIMKILLQKYLSIIRIQILIYCNLIN